MEGDIRQLFALRKTAIKDIMKHMDKTSMKIIFVTGAKGQLIGTITDGDIRRWILSDGNLNESAYKICNRNPVYMEKGAKESFAKDVMKKVIESNVDTVPVVDKDMKIVDIVSWRDLIKKNEEKRWKRPNLKVPLVIMSGGQGARLDPFTRILPKALIPIGDKPVVEVIIDNFLQYICGEIYLILGYKAEMIKSYFDNSARICKINYLHEGREALGTAGGLRFIPRDFYGTFFLSNCDTIIKAKYDDIYGFHKDRRYDITIIGSMQHFMVPYGVMKISAGGELKRIEEKPEYDFLVNTGMYLIEKKVLKYMPKKGVFHITDLIKIIKSKGGSIGVYPVTEKSWLDVGQWNEYKKTLEHL